MKTKKMIRSMSFVAAKLILALGLFTSCNEEFPNLLNEYGEQPDFDSGSSKVLYVIVDGVRGKAMQELNLPNFRVINRNSLHSYGSLGDFTSLPFTKETGLTNLLTGVTSAKHGVEGTDLSTANLSEYPTLVSRINSNNTNFGSVTFTSDTEVSQTLFAGADENVILQNDEEILTQAIREIATGDKDLIITHLTEPYAIGQAHSFETSSQEYVDALHTFDQQIGDLVEAVKSRDTYLQENWLIVISSSIGGPAVNDAVDNTSYGDNERNTITYFYSPKFARSLLIRPNSTEIPFDGNAVRYTYSTGDVRAEVQTPSEFNYNNETDFTVNFFYKQSVPGVQNYPCILNKRAAFDSGAGWQILLSGGAPEFCSNFSNKIKGGDISDGLWHSVTVTVSRSGSADSVKIFVDGAVGGKSTVNTNAMTNDMPFAIGKIPGFNYNNASFVMANLQIYKGVAFTEAEVKQYHGLTAISETNMPHYNKLDGYWPGYDDVGTNKLTDATGRNNNMVLKGSYDWESYSDLVSYFTPPITESFYKLVPNAVDTPFFIYQWFGIVPKASWGLEGKSWTPSLLVSSN